MITKGTIGVVQSVVIDAMLISQPPNYYLNETDARRGYHQPGNIVVMLDELERLWNRKLINVYNQHTKVKHSMFAANFKANK